MNREQLNKLVNDIATDRGITRPEAIQAVADVLNRKPATVRGYLAGHHLPDHTAMIIRISFPEYAQRQLVNTLKEG
jgi:hypothetical protein